MMISLEQILKPVYYDPSSGFQSPSKIHAKVKDNPAFEKGKFTANDVTEWVKKQNVQQVFTHPRKTKELFAPIQARMIDEHWNADLVDMSQFKKENKGMTWILVVVDILSRFMFTAPMKDQTSFSTSNAFEEILSKSQRTPIRLTTDSGGEFKGAFNALIAEKKILHDRVNPGDHRALGKIDAAIKSLKKTIYKWMAATERTDWSTHLKEFTENYNTNPNSSLTINDILRAPSDINNENSDGVFLLEEARRLDVEKNKKKNLLSVGDNVRVRIAVAKAQFPRQRAFKQI
jgi:hypothetical protein